LAAANLMMPPVNNFNNNALYNPVFGGANYNFPLPVYNPPKPAKLNRLLAGLGGGGVNKNV
jgi:hypothetical protein